MSVRPGFAHWHLTDIFFGLGQKLSMDGMTHINIDGTDRTEPTMGELAVYEQLWVFFVFFFWLGQLLLGLSALPIHRSGIIS